MRSLFSFEKVKYEPPSSGMPRRPTIISTVSVTGPWGPCDGHLLRGVLGQQVAQAAQLVRIVPVHPHAEADRLLGLLRGVGQHALLAQADELGDAVRLDVALAGEAELALDVHLDPQALAVEAVLPALVLAEHGVEALEEVLVGPAPGVVDAHRVVGRDGPIDERPALVARVLGAQTRERPAAPATQPGCDARGRGRSG